MAPATNIGAAHPVSVGAGGSSEQKPDETMNEKITNDMAAWAQAVAKERGRNADWAAEAVRKSVSIPAEEALKHQVIDLIAPDPAAVLQAVDGRTVKTSSGTVQLATAHAVLARVPMTARERLLDFLGDPNIAFLFIGLGILGILAELYHPGTLIPGIVGAVSLAVGFVATRMLPVRVGAFVLLLVGAALIAAEFFVTSWGLLAVAGLACVGFGAFLLIDPSNPAFLVDRNFGIDWLTVAPILVVVGGGLALVVWKVTVSRLARPITGVDGMIGEEGVAVADIGPSSGTVRLHGELWEARAARSIASGQRVRVRQLNGLVATVDPVEPGAGQPAA
jgi:membrane-bound serine protease (ClpP class)